ncbi:non-ribosomal peptide synthetase [Paenibacillus riograndensis]|uniref:Carrier domain-containing protein n=1 Tax=Paenibacillus riograndensis SBR5 TaxID=1073571 RepID=A0A0E4CVG1_9BACL|nr:non-ribosomal peptide synthetase [Paenibacillus riograndensis]CQR54137.1 hypothetical protein PRIO_1739 [Paenibacillus riograndensis SBR5]
MKGKFFANVPYLNDVYKKEQQYWLHKLAGLPDKSHFPCEPHKDRHQERHIETIPFSLDPVHARKLVQISNDSDARLHVLLLAFTSVWLLKYSGQTDIVLGTSIYRQPSEEDFINTVLPVRVQVQNEMRLIDLISLMKQTVSEAARHQNYPFELMLKQAGLDSGFLDVSVIVSNIQDEQYLSGTLSNFTMIVHREESVLQGEIRFNAAVYSADTVNQLLEHFHVLLEQSLADLHSSVQELSILTEKDRRIIACSNATSAGFPEEATIPALFEECAAKYPNHTAAEFADERLSYQDLNRKANQAAHHLRRLGVTAESVVALILPPSLEMIIGILAVLKAGGAYLPIDPDLPAQRVDYILKDSQAGQILTVQSLSLPPGTGESCEVIFLDDPMLEQYSSSNLEHVIHPHDLAYIIYTSGTTGNPKGVMIEHRNVVRLFFHEHNRFDFTCQDTWTLFHSFGFDFSVWEIFGALLHGGKLLLIPKLLKRDYRHIVQELRNEHVTVFNQTPSSFYQFMQEELEDTGEKLRLRYVILGGEALQPGKLEAWKVKYPGTRIINMYGITETTVHTTFKEIGTEQIQANQNNIGVPFSTVEVYIFNRQHEQVPIGTVGEIWVGGGGVARGYLNRTELTEDRFQTRRMGDRWIRLYRTGDLGRYLPSGELEYVGRRDNQVKIRGFRIELDEISAHLLTVESIKEAVVSAREIEPNAQILVAYVVIKEGQEAAFDPVEIRQYLQTRISDYMIPSVLLPLSKIPLTLNGKVDYEKLDTLELKQQAKGVLTPPTTEMEHRIAEIWKTSLRMDRIGVHSTIFDLGGTSFDVITISKALSEELGQEVPVITLFTYPTISMLAKVLQADSPVTELSAESREASIEEGKRARRQKLRLLKK